MGRALRGWIVAATLVWALPAVAHADAHVTSLDGRSWAAVVDDLVQRVDSEGTLVPLCVRDGSSACLPCGAYALSFDPAAAAAFETSACDAQTGVTTLRLAHRAMLFDHDHAVPVPRAIGVHASLASEDTGESTQPRAAGTGVACSVHLRPYLRDLEHGVLVVLGADAYDVRVARVRVQVQPSEDGGFIVSSTDGTATELSYDVVERASGAVVLVGHASMTCSSSADVPATAAGTVGPEPARAVGLASPRRQHSGLRVAPHDSDRDIGQALTIAGVALATASALTLVGIGIGTLIHTSGSCTSWSSAPSGGGSSTGTSTSSALSGSRSTCVAWGPPHPSETPAELTWSMVGGLGAGVVVGLLGLLVTSLAPSHDDAPRVSLELGPSGGSLGLSGTF